MTVEVRFCPHCGTRRTGYFRFCGRCGFDFDDLMLGKPEAGAADGAEPSKPEPTTPIWPQPTQWPPAVQWPPPDAGPSAEPSIPAIQEPTAAPSPERTAALVNAAAGVMEERAASVERPIAPGLAPASPPASPPVLLAAPVEPVPTPPVTGRRPLVTWTRIGIITLAAVLVVNAIANAIGARQTGPTLAPTVVIASPLVVDSAAPSGTPTSGTSTTGANLGPPNQTQFAVVTRIVDGDTIHVDIDGSDFPLRYIGIDTPEPDSPDPAEKRLADSATAANAGLVEGRDVYLEKDTSETDQYGRLLRYVWFVSPQGDMTMVNHELVRLGFAHATSYPPDVRYDAVLAQAQAAAQSDAIGLWAPAAVLESAAPATPQTLVGGTTASKCHPSYTPCLPIVGDLDCPDVVRIGAAPVHVKGPDDYRLDRDNDGLGCE